MTFWPLPHYRFVRVRLTRPMQCLRTRLINAIYAATGGVNDSHLRRWRYEGGVRIRYEYSWPRWRRRGG